MPNYNNFGVLSLADVLEKQRIDALRQDMIDQQMKMQEYQRGIQGERTLADITAQQQPIPAMLPGQPAVPAQVMPEGVLGPPRPATPEVPSIPNPEDNPLGRLENQSRQRREASQKMSESGYGAIAQKLASEADAIDERLFQYRILSAEKKSASNRAVTDNELAIVASGGVTGNPNADMLGRSGAIAALKKKPMLVAEGVRVLDKSMAGGGILNTKTIPDVTSSKLTAMSGGVEDSEYLMKNFNPRFAGHQVTRDWQRRIDEMFKNDVEAANFWGTQARQQNKERHELFGGALTPTEFQEWRNQAIHPGMTPDVMKSRLANQNAVLTKAARRFASGLKSEGKFSEDSILQYLGGRKDLMAPFEPTSGQSNNKQPTTWEDGQYLYRRLTDGTVQRKKK